MRKRRYQNGGPVDPFYPFPQKTEKTKSSSKSVYELTTTSDKPSVGSRNIDRSTIKGKNQYLDLHGVLPEQENSTLLGNAISHRAYNTLRPSTYEAPSYEDFIKNKSRFRDVTEEQTQILTRLTELATEKGPAARKEYEKKWNKLSSYRDKTGEDDPYSEDGWNMYLGLPQKNKTFTVSEYAPTKAKDKNVTYYRLPEDFKQDLYDTFKERDFQPFEDNATTEFHLGNNLGENASRGRVLGNFTTNIGEDENGKYISYYDKYDLSPTLPVVGKTKLENVVGKPFEIYDRIYLKDFENKSTNKATGGHLQNNQMRKKRNYAPGGYMDPYQLATQQGVAGVQQMNANKLATAGNTGNGFNLGNIAAGGMDPYSMIAAQVTKIAGDYGSAINYKAQLGPEKSQKDYNKEILMAGLQGGVIGAIPTIMRMNKDKNTIVHGSPGTYQNGGPIQGDPIQRPLQQNITRNVDRIDRDMIQSNYYKGVQRTEAMQQAATNTLDSFNPFYKLIATGVPALNAIDTFDYGHSSKIKSKDRFREKATGGSLGDQQLSNSAFQVKYNSNETDAKSYPEFNANLDRNEVVDQNAKFVFSDDLKIPNTKKSFAQAAKPLYKKVGDLETRKDPISLATKEQINKQINSLAMTQEQLATALGLRNNQSQGMAAGGFTGGPKLPWEGFDIAQFETWYNSMPGGSKLAVDGKWNSAKQKAYEAVAYDYMKATGKNTVTSFGATSTEIPLNGLPSGDQYVNVQPIDGKLLPSSIGEPQKIPTQPIYIQTPEGPVDISGLDGSTPQPRAAETIQDREARVVTPYGRIQRGVDPMVNPNAAPMDMTEKPLVTTNGMYNQGFTAGDIMQGIEVGSKFFNINEGPEQEGQLLNTTPVTKTGYDVNPALYQNQRNYRNTVNGIGTSSAPQRRAMSNQLLATKLNADNQVMSNYQNMNNEATISYEGRLNQQRQQNIASAFQTNNLNAANRGMYDQAQQNAFTSVGNFGEALNKRKMSYDALRLLQINYPEIYDDVMKDFEATGIKKKTTQIKVG